MATAVLARSQALSEGDLTEASLFNDTADEIRRLLHQFAAGFLKAPPAELVARLVDHERHNAERLHAQSQLPEAPDSTLDAHDLMFDDAMLPAVPVQALVVPSPAIAALPEPQPSPEPLSIEAQDSASAPL